MGNHATYSNIALSLRFALPATGLEGFLGAPDSFGLKLEDRTAERPWRVFATELNRDTPCALNVRFFHDEPDFRQTLPAVPG
ncbi:hypothetical protein [Rhodospirillum sp. A1_3_36]|uniref:hypothetical protein n=1 Tax=Rhodospirillum sp. A1_3_36 TaxID=3391666 RepID=UPI0039A6007E